MIRLFGWELFTERREILPYVAYFVGLFACTPVITFFGYSLYIWFTCLFVLLIVWLVRPNIRLTSEMPFFLAAIITFLAVNGTLTAAYAGNNFKGFVAIAIASIAGMFLCVDRKCSEFLIRGVLLGAKLNVAWIFIQTFAITVLSVDLNNLIFVQLLGTVEAASQIKATGVVSTGLCWNVGGIAASLFVLFMLERSQGWKIAVLGAALLTQSSTTAIGLGLCVIWKLVRHFIEHTKVTISRASIYAACFALAAIAMAAIFSGSFQQSLGKIIGATIGRVLRLFNGSGLDSSTAAHLNYYVNLPSLIKDMSPMQILFGYGIDCSGLPYTQLTSQYWWLDSWFIESDPVNTFLGMGLFGLVALYTWLIYSAIKTFRVCRDIGVLLLIFIVCGLFYDLQSVTYYWLLVVELSLIGVTAQNSPIGNWTV